MKDVIIFYVMLLKLKLFDDLFGSSRLHHQRHTKKTYSFQFNLAIDELNEGF